MLLRTLRRLDIADNTFAFKFTPNELQVLRNLHAALKSTPACPPVRTRVWADRTDYPTDLGSFSERWIITTDVDLAATELGMSVKYSKMFSARYPDRIAYTANVSDASRPADEIDAINVLIHFTRTTAFAQEYGALDRFETLTLHIVKYALVNWRRMRDLGAFRRRILA
ncbi:hypothetical protein PsYK624_063610 [Phanerochaete sordida]|uniref:Uncharacterized protein n=1 Tax=Phanerochaete sordida TaxID=48140 RepID=A0A9P3G6L5_9APHY|nr:hypothetical protein PsYK624_063610 [Phanerochaete sordida]